MGRNVTVTEHGRPQPHAGICPGKATQQVRVIFVLRIVGTQGKVREKVTRWDWSFMEVSLSRWVREWDLLVYRKSTWAGVGRSSGSVNREGRQMWERFRKQKLHILVIALCHCLGKIIRVMVASRILTKARPWRYLPRDVARSGVDSRPIVWWWWVQLRLNPNSKSH